jgi:DNA-binding protein H-NS
MAQTTLAQLQKQIAQLQAQAEVLRKSEAAEVIAKIKEAVAHYGLTEVDIFGRKTKRGTAPAIARAAIERAKSAKPPAKAGRPIKYRDESGNAWGGMGKRPEWFKAALAAGKTPADLLA